LAGAALATATLTAWLVTGAHRGWTRTSEAVEKTDEVTGLTYRTYQPCLKLGLDALGIGLGLSLAAGLIAWLATPGHNSTKKLL